MKAFIFHFGLAILAGLLIGFPKTAAEEIFATSFLDNPGHGWREGMDGPSNGRLAREIVTSEPRPGIVYSGVNTTGNGWKTTFRHFGGAQLGSVTLAPGERLMIDFDWTSQDAISSATFGQIAVFRSGNVTPVGSDPPKVNAYAGHFRMITSEPFQAGVSVSEGPWDAFHTYPVIDAPDGWGRNVTRRLRFTLHRIGPSEVELLLSDTTVGEQVLMMKEIAGDVIDNLDTVMVAVRRTFSANISRLDRFDNFEVQLIEELPLAVTDASVLPTGAVELRWRMPRHYSGGEVFDIFRSEDPDDFAIHAIKVGQTNHSFFVDRTTAAGVTYFYQVVPVGADGSSRTPSEVVGLTIGEVVAPLPLLSANAYWEESFLRLSWIPGHASRGEILHVYRWEIGSNGMIAIPVGQFALGDGEAMIPADGKDTLYAFSIVDPEGRESAKTTVSVSGFVPENEHLGQPRSHPFVLLNQDEIDWIKDRIETHPHYRHAYENGLLVDAEESYARSGPANLSIPATRSSLHQDIALDTQRMALGYVFSGDVKFANAAADILLYYGDNYTNYPVDREWVDGRLTSQTLNEAMLLIYLAWAYDLLHHRFTAGERSRIEDGLLREGVEVVNMRDRGNSNWQSWHNAATGIIGFLLDDEAMIHRAIWAANGFRDHLVNALLPDGIWYEQSIDYHYYTMHSLTYLAEAAYRYGYDLYRLRMGEQVLKLAYDGPLYHAFSNLGQPIFGNSATGRRLIAPDVAWNYAIAFARYGDPNFRWFWDKEYMFSARLTGDSRRPILLCLPLLERPIPSAPEVSVDYSENFTGANGTMPEGWLNIIEGDGMSIQQNRFVFRRHNSDSSGFRRTAIYYGPGSEDWKDYTAEVWFMDTRQHDTAQPHGIVARVQPGEVNQFPAPGGYFAYHEGGTLRIERDLPRAAPGQVLASAGLLEPLEQNQYYRLQFILSGSDLEARLFHGDGRLIGLVRATDEAYVAGPAGLRAYHTFHGRETRFDDFSVTGSAFSPGALPPRFSIGSGHVGTAIRNSWGSSLLSGVGMGVLRGTPGQRTPEVAFIWKPYGTRAGHQHPNNLAIHWQTANHRWLSGSGKWAGYSEPVHLEWVKTTLSDNTVVVDRTSQYPAYDGAPSHVSDNPVKPSAGWLNAFVGGPVFQYVDGATDKVYQDVTLRRRVFHTEDYTLDVFRGEALRPRLFDWVVHPDGQLASSNVSLASSDPLATGNGYQYLQNLQSGETSGNWETRWTNGARQLRLVTLGTPGTKVVSGRGPWSGGTRGVALVSRSGSSANFVTLIQDAQGIADRTVEWIGSESIATHPSAGAVRVTGPDAIDELHWNPEGLMYSSNEYTLTARAGMVRMQNDTITAVTLVRGMGFAADGVEVEAEIPASFAVVRHGTSRWTLNYEEPFEQLVSLRLDGEEWQVFQLDGRGEVAGAVGFQEDGGWIRWQADPFSSYLLTQGGTGAPRHLKNFPEHGRDAHSAVGMPMAGEAAFSHSQFLYGGGHDWLYFYVDLAEGIGAVEFRLDDLSIATDMFVRHGFKPTESLFDARSPLPRTGDQVVRVVQPQAGRWWIGVRAVQSGQLDFLIQSREFHPFESWSTWRTYFYEGYEEDDAVSGPMADPGGRGVPNLLRYAFGMDGTAGREALPWTEFVESETEEYLSLVFYRLKEASDVVYQVEGSPDLADWQEATAIPEVLWEEGEVEVVRVRDSVPVGSVPARFLRVRVDLDTTE